MDTKPILIATALLVSLAAMPAASVDLGAGITNVAPTIVSITLTGLTAGTLTPASGTTASITATVVASDLNGFNDLSGVTVGIIKPDGSTVHVAQAAATAGAGSGLTRTYTKTLTMNYYDAAATGASTYKVKAIATDSGLLTGVNVLSMATFNYAQLVAVSAPSSATLGASAITPGQAGDVGSITMTNSGNQQMDLQVSGTDLTYLTNTIPVADIGYSLSSDMSSSAALSGVATTLTSFDLASGSSSTKTVYFQLTETPTGLPAGTYTGTLTVTAVAG